MKKFLLWVAKVCKVDLVEIKEVEKVVEKSVNFELNGNQTVEGDLIVNGNLVVKGSLKATGSVICLNK